jgi:hypothetical protein
METINATAREQFVTDYCLVVDNDEESYRNIIGRQTAKAGNVSGLSDDLRSEFETYISPSGRKRIRGRARNRGAANLSNAYRIWLGGV